MALGFAGVQDRHYRAFVELVSNELQRLIDPDGS